MQYLDEQQHHLGACENTKFLSSIPHPLNQKSAGGSSNPWFNKPSRWCWCTWVLENLCPKSSPTMLYRSNTWGAFQTLQAARHANYSRRFGGGSQLSVIFQTPYVIAKFNQVWDPLCEGVTGSITDTLGRSQNSGFLFCWQSLQSGCPE